VSEVGDIVAEKAAGTPAVAPAFPFNPIKSAKYDPDALADRLTSEGCRPALPSDDARFGATSRQPGHRGGRQPGGGASRPPRHPGSAEGPKAIHGLRADGRTVEFIKDQHRHCKPVGASDRLLTTCGIETALPTGQPDPGVITTSDASTASDGFIAAIAKHRHFERETDPPRV
jgi:hypothetical protein